MGLTIHYRGTLENPNLIRPLTEEVADICEVLEWKFVTIADERLKGISITPENCEAITLTFQPDGKLTSPIFLLVDMPADSYIFTKTQYAGMDTHIAIIRLLRYLSDKYFENFELIDEGNFWETNDSDVLRLQFSRYEAALDAVTNVLQDFPIADGETSEGLVGRLEAYLQKRLKE